MSRNAPHPIPDRTTRPLRQGPLPADWLLLTDADRAMAALDEALRRTSRWQGNAA